jgi:hypothetical protein
MIAATVRVQAALARSKTPEAKRERSQAKRIERGARGLWSDSERSRQSRAIRERVGGLHARLPQELGLRPGHIVRPPRKPVAVKAFAPREELEAAFGENQPENIKGLLVSSDDATAGQAETWIRFDDPIEDWEDYYAAAREYYEETGSTAGAFGIAG